MPLTPEEKAAKAAQKAPKSAKKNEQGAVNEQNQSEPDENSPETQKIKFLRSHPRYGYWPGATADLTAEHVTLLVDGGFAELVAEPAADIETED
jgi:hypothetical protein